MGQKMCKRDQEDKLNWVDRIELREHIKAKQNKKASKSKERKIFTSPDRTLRSESRRKEEEQMVREYLSPQIYEGYKAGDPTLLFNKVNKKS